MTPAESHARNHICHPLLPLIENSPFLSSANEFPHINRLSLLRYRLGSMTFV